MVSLTLEERLDTVRFKIDDEPHIHVQVEICRDCTARACVCACPAKLFTPLEDGGLLYTYEHCFECGTCYLVCSQPGAVEWSYPRGGYGVTFREA